MDQAKEDQMHVVCPKMSVARPPERCIHMAWPVLSVAHVPLEGLADRHPRCVFVISILYGVPLNKGGPTDMHHHVELTAPVVCGIRVKLASLMATFCVCLGAMYCQISDRLRR